MLEIKHLQVNKAMKHLFADVSFILESHGFTSILCYDDESDLLLAQYLCGIKRIEKGQLYYYDQLISLQEYRKHVVMGLIEDLLVFENRSVVDNITLLYPVDEVKLRKILFDLKLVDIKNKEVQTLNFALRVRVLIARCLYFDYPLVVFYPKSSKYAVKERMIIYEQFKKYYPNQFVVIGDDISKNYASRIIEFDHGYLISDNIKVIQTNKNNVYNHQRTMNYDIYKNEMNSQYRWIYRCLFILVVVMMVITSILVNTTTLNEQSIQARMIEEEKIVEIEKHFIDNHQHIHIDTLDYITKDDIDLLNKQLQANLVCDYNALDPKYSLAYLEGYYGKEDEKYPISSEYNISEYLDESMKKDLLVGYFPKNHNEVVLSISAIETILGKYQTLQEVLNKSFYWYGDELKVVGILQDKDEYEHRLFVLEGYMKQHLLANMEVFPLAKKEIVVDNQIYQIDDIQKEQRLYYFVDEEGIKYNYILKPQEVVLGYEVAKALGFSYEEDIENYSQYLKFIVEYQKFIMPYLGKTINLNAFRSNQDKLHTQVLQDEFTILGFVPPSYEEAQNKTTYYGKVAYLQNNYLDSYFVENIKIEKTYYYSKHQQISKEDLAVFNEYNHFKILYKHSNLLSLLVFDFKALTSFFAILLLVFAFLTYVLYYILMKKNLNSKRKDASLYYRLGESKEQITMIYEQHYLQKVSRYIKVATICGLSIQFIYLYLVVTILNGAIYYFVLMLLPILIACIFYVLFILIAKLLLKEENIFIEVYGGSNDE